MGIRDLIDAFRKKRGKIKALNNVTFEVNKGDVFGLSGPNGAEKPPSARSSPVW